MQLVKAHFLSYILSRINKIKVALRLSGKKNRFFWQKEYVFWQKKYVFWQKNTSHLGTLLLEGIIRLVDEKFIWVRCVPFRRNALKLCHHIFRPQRFPMSVRSHSNHSILTYHKSVLNVHNLLGLSGTQMQGIANPLFILKPMRLVLPLIHGRLNVHRLQCPNCVVTYSSDKFNIGFFLWNQRIFGRPNVLEIRQASTNVLYPTPNQQLQNTQMCSPQHSFLLSHISRISSDFLRSPIFCLSLL
jgi:hypothetical protein